MNVGKTRKQLDGLGVVRRCWKRLDDDNGEDCGSKDDCFLEGCPYAGDDECDIHALLDTIELAERLYKKLKRKERKNRVDPNQ